MSSARRNGYNAFDPTIDPQDILPDRSFTYVTQWLQGWYDGERDHEVYMARKTQEQHEQEMEWDRYTEGCPWRYYDEGSNVCKVGPECEIHNCAPWHFKQGD